MLEAANACISHIYALEPSFLKIKKAPAGMLEAAEICKVRVRKPKWAEIGRFGLRLYQNGCKTDKEAF